MTGASSSDEGAGVVGFDGGSCLRLTRASAALVFARYRVAWLCFVAGRAAAGLEECGPYSPPHGFQRKGSALGAVSPFFGCCAPCKTGDPPPRLALPAARPLLWPVRIEVPQRRPPGK
jgi:hypothetical protein